MSNSIISIHSSGEAGLGFKPRCGQCQAGDFVAALFAPQILRSEKDVKLLCNILLQKYLNGGREGSVRITMIWVHDYKESGNSLTSLGALFRTMVSLGKVLCFPGCEQSQRCCGFDQEASHRGEARREKSGNSQDTQRQRLTTWGGLSGSFCNTFLLLLLILTRRCFLFLFSLIF